MRIRLLWGFLLGCAACTGQYNTVRIWKMPAEKSLYKLATEHEMILFSAAGDLSGRREIWCEYLRAAQGSRVLQDEIRIYARILYDDPDIQPTLAFTVNESEHAITASDLRIAKQVEPNTEVRREHGSYTDAYTRMHLNADGADTRFATTYKLVKIVIPVQEILAQTFRDARSVTLKLSLNPGRGSVQFTARQISAMRKFYSNTADEPGED